MELPPVIEAKPPGRGCVQRTSRSTLSTEAHANLLRRSNPQTSATDLSLQTTVPLQDSPPSPPLPRASSAWPPWTYSLFLLPAAFFLARAVEHWGSPLPLCGFHSLTGYPCPFCGGTRGAIALSHGRITEAFLHNPLTVILPLGLLAFTVLPEWRHTMKPKTFPVLVALCLLNWAALLLKAARLNQ